MARNVWAMVEGKLQKRSSYAEDFYSLVKELAPVLTKKEMEVWAVVSWAIWNARKQETTALVWFSVCLLIKYWNSKEKIDTFFLRLFL